MVAVDEDALICDLAETYHIYDYRSLPLQRVAIFAAGLRENSRIKTIMSGLKYPLDTMLLGLIVDRLSLLVWMQTKNGMKGINRPEPILGGVISGEKADSEIESFNTPEEFKKRWLEITGGGLNG